MKKEIDGYITIEEHRSVVAEWKKSVDEIVAELKNRNADHIRIRRTIIYSDEKKQLVSEWRAQNELDSEGYVRDKVGKVRGEDYLHGNKLRDHMGHDMTDI